MKLRLRCGFSPLLRQTRRTVVAPVPKCSANVRVLQCVTLAGLWCKETGTMRDSLSAVTVAGRPARGSSLRSASMPPCRNRCRHSATWRRFRPTSTAMSLFCGPRAASKTTCALCCNRAYIRRPLANTRSSRPMSSSCSIVLAIPTARSSWAIGVCRDK